MQSCSECCKNKPLPEIFIEDLTLEKFTIDNLRKTVGKKLCDKYVTEYACEQLEKSEHKLGHTRHIMLALCPQDIKQNAAALSDIDSVPSERKVHLMLDARQKLDGPEDLNPYRSDAYFELKYLDAFGKVHAWNIVRELYEKKNTWDKKLKDSWKDILTNLPALHFDFQLTAGLYRRVPKYSADGSLMTQDDIDNPEVKYSQEYSKCSSGGENNMMDGASQVGTTESMTSVALSEEDCPLTLEASEHLDTEQLSMHDSSLEKLTEENPDLEAGADSRIQQIQEFDTAVQKSLMALASTVHGANLEELKPYVRSMFMQTDMFRPVEPCQSGDSIHADTSSQEVVRQDGAELEKDGKNVESKDNTTDGGQVGAITEDIGESEQIIKKRIGTFRIQQGRGESRS